MLRPEELGKLTVLFVCDYISDRPNVMLLKSDNGHYIWSNVTDYLSPERHLYVITEEEFNLVKEEREKMISQTIEQAKKAREEEEGNENAEPPKTVTAEMVAEHGLKGLVIGGNTLWYKTFMPTQEQKLDFVVTEQAGKYRD
uniref:Uncharacterized protein n=1 Tax=viral metagenome TaxID=1070528 RepID=A0A6C0JWD1_9ZZZZ